MMLAIGILFIAAGSAIIGAGYVEATYCIDIPWVWHATGAGVALIGGVLALASQVW